MKETLSKYLFVIALAISLLAASSSSFAAHGGWHGGGGGGWHGGNGWNGGGGRWHGGGWNRWNNGWGWGGGVFVGVGSAYYYNDNYEPYYYQYCRWIPAHYNVYGYWIPDQRVCW
jgi:hypothetical protein